MSFNKVILVGNLGKDPELRHTTQGDPVCSFTMATNERKKNRDTGEQEDFTTWFRITLFGKQAETAAQYLVKGRPVYIEGRLRMETYTDKQGQERTSLEVRATDMQFIGSKSDSESDDTPKASAASAGGGASSRTAPSASLPHDDGDIPF